MPTLPTTPPDITDLSTPPNRIGSTDTAFVAAVDTFFGELPTFGTEQNALADWSETTAGQTYLNANEAFTSATNAATSEQNASDYSEIAESVANFKGKWSTATGAAVVGDSYSHDSETWRVEVAIADITLSEPARTNSDWQVINDVNMANVDLTRLSSPLMSIFKPNKVVDTLSGTLSSARAGAATYTDIYGIIRSVDVDQIREESGDFLIEDSSTNNLLHSIDASNAAWTKSAGMSVIANDITSCIDGELADRLTNTAGSLAEHISQSYSYTDTGQEVTSYFIVKAGTVSSVNIRMLMTGGTSIDRSYNFDFATEDFTSAAVAGTKRTLVNKLIDGFYWISITLTGNGTNNTISSRLSSTDVGTLYYAASQSESGNKATSLIITGASSSTRVVDNITAPTINNLPALNKSYSMHCNINNIGDFTGSAKRLISVACSSGVWTVFASSSSNQMVLRADDNITINQLTAVPADINNFSITVTFDEESSLLSMYIDGEIKSSKVVSTFAVVDLSSIMALFALQTLAAGDRCSGNISNLAFFNGTLTPDEIKLL